VDVSSANGADHQPGQSLPDGECARPSSVARAGLRKARFEFLGLGQLPEAGACGGTDSE
jgi:hypothetical protein